MAGSPGSVAKSVSSAGIELTSAVPTPALTFGLYQILNDTAIAASINPTNAIPTQATNGMRIFVRVWNHTAVGTVTVVGTAPGSAQAVTETSYSLAVPDKFGEYVDYTTSAVYGVVTASGGFTTSGLTGGRIAAYGIQKATRMMIGETKIMDKMSSVSPSIQYGHMVKDRYNIRTGIDPEWEFTGPFFPNQFQLWYQTAISNAATPTTAPASPTSLLASTSVVTGASIGLSSPPTAPAMILVCVLGGTTATAASVTITGKNQQGQSISEVVIPTTLAIGTYYSKNAFASVTAVTGVTWGSFGGTATLTVGGIFCNTNATTTPNDDALASFVIENYNSVQSQVAVGCFTDELALEFGWKQELKLTAKGHAQAVCLVGTLSQTNPSNQVTAPAQEPEEALSGWEMLAYLDNVSSTIGTTQQADIVSGKLTIKPMWKYRHLSKFNPPSMFMSQAFRHYAEADLEVLFDMTQATYASEYQAFKQNKERLIRFVIRGHVAYGTVSTTQYYAGATIDVAGYWIDVPEVDWSNGKESVELKLKLRIDYDPILGYAWNVTPTNQLPAGWT